MKLSLLLLLSLITWTNLGAMAAQNGRFSGSPRTGVLAEHRPAKQDVSDTLQSGVPPEDWTGDKTRPTVFSVDGLTIANDEHSWTAPLHDDMDSLPTTPLRFDQSIPVVVSPMGSEAQKFNTAARMLALQLWNDAGGELPPEAPVDGSDLDLSLKYALNSNSIKNIISIKMLIYINNRAGARSNEIFSNLNYDIRKERLVKQSDLFVDDSNWCSVLTTESVSVLQNDSENTLPELYGQTLEEVSMQMQKWACDPGRWIITSKGLEIDYGSEEVGAYAVGTPSTFLSWASLREILNPNASKLYSVGGGA